MADSSNLLRLIIPIVHCVKTNTFKGWRGGVRFLFRIINTDSHHLSERAQSLEPQHVPGDQSGNCRYLYWRPFDLACLVCGKRL